VAIGGEDGSVRLVDLETGEQRAAVGSHVAEVLGARFTPDGRTLVTTGAGDDVIVWDVQRATAVETLPGNPGACSRPRSHATARPSTRPTRAPRRLGRQFSTGAQIAQPGLAAVVPGQAFLALSSDGRLIARGHDDGAVTNLDGHTLARQRSFPVVTPGAVHGLGFLPRSRLVVVTGPRGFLALADADRERVLKRAPEHIGDVLPSAISAGGRLLVTAGDDDQTVRLWSLPDMRPVVARLRFGDGIEDVQISPDGRRLTIVLFDPSGASARLEVWDAASRRRVTRLGAPDTHRCGRRLPKRGGRSCCRPPTGSSSRSSALKRTSPASRRVAGRRHTCDDQQP
jgi:WD40 repeat protein